MKKLTVSILLLFVTLFSFAEEKTINVLLIGDSTTEGATPRMLNPDRFHLSKVMETWYNAQSNDTKLNVMYSSKGGETAKSIFDTKRYEEEVLPFKDKDIDIIIVRYGINDSYKIRTAGKDVNKEFPEYLNNLYNRLEKDFPKAKFISQTLTPFIPEEENVKVTAIIYKIAEDRGYEVNDIYTPFAKEMEKNGEADYWVRIAPLKNFPEIFHEMLKPYTVMREGEPSVQVDDNSLDPLFMNNHAPGTTVEKWAWVNHHPNSAGYSIVARETANFLLDYTKRHNF